jgi:hypothetical protein
VTDDKVRIHKYESVKSSTYRDSAKKEARPFSNEDTFNSTKHKLSYLKKDSSNLCFTSSNYKRHSRVVVEERDSNIPGESVFLA